MTWEKRVVWSQGMMLQPQHFQQQARYHDAQLRDTMLATIPYTWGLSSISIDTALLKTGKVCVHQAKGMLQDGSVFSFPDNDNAPKAIDITQNELGATLYLAVSIRRSDITEVQRDNDRQTRFAASEFETRDVSGISNTKALIEVSGLHFSLRTSKQDNSEYSCIGFAQIDDVHPSGDVLLSTKFIAPTLNIVTNSLISSFLEELLTLTKHRIHSLASRITVTGKSTGSEIADYMMLQGLNRHYPGIAYLRNAEQVHPFFLYEKLCTLIAELSTFVKSDNLVTDLPHYEHTHLTQVFADLIAELRSLFSVVLEQNSVNIPLQERKFGIRVGTITDKTLFDSASFILAVSADISPEDIRKFFPQQTKIGSVESIKELVNLQLPGIQMTHLAAAPREVPYQRNFVYFELVQSGDDWQALCKSGGVACHISNNFPGLSVELWAVRN